MAPHARMCRIERHVIDKAEAMDHSCGAVVSLIIGDPSGVLRGLPLLAERGLIAFFDAKKIAETVGVEGLDRRGMGTQTVCSDDALAVGMVLAPRGHKPVGGMACTIIVVRPIVLHTRFRHQGHHCPHVRMKHRCAQHRMNRGERTMAVDFLQTRGTVHGLGGKISRPIARQSRVPITKRHRCKRLATLEVPKDTRAHRAEHCGGARVKDLAHVRVARDPLHAVDDVHMALGPLLGTGQERGRWEGKHGKGRPERIREGNLGIPQTVIWQAGTTALHQAKERIGGQMLPSW